MAEITIKTQAELDALPAKFEEYTHIYIQGGTPYDRIVVRVAWENSSVEAWGNSSVEARENSSVEAWENSSVVARGNSSVVARGNSSVEARENSSVVARGNSSVEAWENSSVEAWENSSVVARGNSSVVARGNSSVEARENSSVVARGNSSVEAWENSSVEAWGNSSVEARENSSVEARENSSVVAWENSSVVARGNSSVVAWGNSSVEAWGNVGVHLRDDSASVVLYMFAVCWALSKGKIIKKSKTATIIKPKPSKGTQGWLEAQAVKKAKETVILFKRVSFEWKTQEGTAWETIWEPGKTLEHPAWSPEKKECGEGKFHACSRPYFCDEFRSKINDKYIAVQIDVKDLYAWDGGIYPHKIAFRKGKVLYQCDKYGKAIKTEVK